MTLQAEATHIGDFKFIVKIEGQYMTAFKIADNSFGFTFSSDLEDAVKLKRSVCIKFVEFVKRCLSEFEVEALETAEPDNDIPRFTFIAKTPKDIPNFFRSSKLIPTIPTLPEPVEVECTRHADCDCHKCDDECRANQSRESF